MPRQVGRRCGGERKNTANLFVVLVLFRLVVNVLLIPQREDGVFLDLYVTQRVPLGILADLLSEFGTEVVDDDLLPRWSAYVAIDKLRVVRTPEQLTDYASSFPALSPDGKWIAFHWTQDSRNLTYIEDKQGVSNIWAQPLDGSSPRQLTNFPAGVIYNFAWSPDGRPLALARGSQTNDVVLIRSVVTNQ